MTIYEGLSAESADGDYLNERLRRISPKPFEKQLARSRRVAMTGGLVIGFALGGLAVWVAVSYEPVAMVQNLLLSLGL
ncbi:MAG: hypothetical protein QNL53_02180 [Microbacteriaceae bacterium]